MKIEINFPKKSGDVEEVRKLFRDQITRPIEKMAKEFGFNDNFSFYDVQILSEMLAPKEVVVAAGFFYHIGQDLDDACPHHFHFYLNGNGVIGTCSDCNLEELQGTWAEIMWWLMVMFKRELRKIRRCTSEIERLGKVIGLLKT